MSKILTATRVSTALVASFLLASCAPEYAEPKQQFASNPTVTYVARSDQEMLGASQQAMAYCRDQYKGSARTKDIAARVDGAKNVQFECVAQAPATTPPPPTAAQLAYRYASDQDLLNAAREAELQCWNNSSQHAVTKAVMSPEGLKTVTFLCQ